MTATPPIARRPKFIGSVCLRGFEMKPAEVEALIGVPASSSVARGEARVPNGTPFRRSAVSWEIEFSDATRLGEMIPALLSRVGGVDQLMAIKARVMPEFIEFDIAMWILGSDEQEGGGIDAGSVASLAMLGASLSMGFYARDPG
ncbi:hypothetical protein ACQQ2N_03170 [Dokdonella sp. MW10]|uniref:hypothetical protein n=1 Tax=Dokdonella sp. MW10 TaxID=2992926 RepID=UPI003F8140C2